jgi:hypothetical protein
VSLAGDPEVSRGVAERIVAGGVDGVADQQFLGFGRRELRRQRHRLVGGEHEIESGVLSDMLAPVGAVVGAARLEQRVELTIAGI